MVIQKDWLFWDIEHGDLFCVSIARFDPRKGRGCRRQNKQWYLTRYVNFFDLDSTQIQNLLSKNTSYLLNSSQNAVSYSFVVFHHNFVSEDMNAKYWRGVLRNKVSSHVDSYLESARLPINKKMFELEISRLSMRENNRAITCFSKATCE